MTQLISTVPGAWDDFFSMIQTAVAAGSDTTITVVDTELYQWEPAQYIELQSVENHSFEINNLGDYSFLEHYSLSGVCRNFRGDNNVAQARADVWSLYQTYLMTPLITNKRLGNNVIWCVPESANFTSTPTTNGGIQGLITYQFLCYAQITV